MSLAGKLTAKDFSVTVCNVTWKHDDTIKAAGAGPVFSPQELVADRDFIISTLDDITATNEFFARIWETIKDGAIVIITGNIGPECCTKLYAKSLLKKFTVIDVGISGRALMASGDEKAVKAATPILEAIAEHVFYVGTIGTGQAYKLINDLAKSGYEGVIRECLDFGLKADLNLDKMIEILRAATMESLLLENLVNEYKLKKQQAPANTLALEMAKAFGAALPLLLCSNGIDEKSTYHNYVNAMEEKLHGNNLTH